MGFMVQGLWVCGFRVFMGLWVCEFRVYGFRV